MKGHLPGHKLRTDTSDCDPDIESAFYFLKHTYCAAVHTENLFMDNREDCSFLLSDAGRKDIIGLHVELWRISMKRSRSRSGRRRTA